MIRKLFTTAAVLTGLLTFAAAAPAADKPLAESLYFFYDFDTPARLNGSYFPVNLPVSGFTDGHSGRGFLFRDPGRNRYAPKTSRATDPEAFQNTPLRRIRVEKISVSDMMSEMDDAGLASADDADSGKKKELDPTVLHPDEKWPADPDALEFQQDPDFADGKTILARKGSLCVKPISFGTSAAWRVQYADAFVGSAWVKGKKGSKLRIEVAPTEYKGSLSAAAAKWLRFHKEENPNCKKTPPFVPDAFFPQTVELTGEWQRVAAYVTFDCRLNERQIAFNMTTEDKSPFQARQFQLESRPFDTPNPVDWIPGGDAIPTSNITITGMEQMKDFPEKEGALLFHVKFNPNTNLPIVRGPIFSGIIQVHDPNLSLMKKALGRGDKLLYSTKDHQWQTAALVWDEQSVSVYCNGKRTGRFPRKYMPNPKKASSMLGIGSSGHMNKIGANAVLDDIAIFNRTLTQQEITDLHRRKDSLLSDSTDLLGTPPYGTQFARNGNPARFSFGVFAPRDMETSAVLKIGETVIPGQKVLLKKGKCDVTIGFPAWKFSVGKYPYEITLTGADGSRCFHAEGELEIIPSVRRDVFPVVSWGGSSPIELDYAKMIGANVIHISSSTPQEIVELYGRSGVYFSPRLENSGQFGKTGEELETNIRFELERFSNYPNWLMTLCNTEVYGGGWLDLGKKVPSWVEFAKKSLGFEPVYGCISDTGIRRPQDWKRPEDGILEDDDQRTKTALFLFNGGMGAMLVNAVNRRVIHSMSPGNIVWSEPGVPFGVDLTASWEYDYSTSYVWFGAKEGSHYDHSYNNCRYMPTLTMSYYTPIRGAVRKKEKKKAFDPLKDIPAEDELMSGIADDMPKTEPVKEEDSSIPVEICESEDELIIKTWLVLGCVPSEAYSIFALDAWPSGAKNAARENPEPNVVINCESDLGKAYGAVMHSTLIPMATMLSGVMPVKNKVAIYIPQTSALNAGMAWGYYWNMRQFKSGFGSAKLDFDILDDRATADELRSYAHIFFPCAKAVMRSNYEKLLKTASTSTIYTDYLCTQNYSNAKRFDNPDNHKDIKTPLAALSKDLREKLKPELPAWADGEDGPLFASARRDGDELYFVIVNDARRDGGPQTTYLKNNWFKPHGKEQKNVVVSLQIPENWTLYDFNSSCEVPFRHENGRAVVSTAFGSAEGRLYCAVPERFESLKLEKPEFREGENRIRVVLTTKSGKQPSGRQIVRAEIKSGSEARDESGWYVLQNGVGEIRVWLKSGEDAKNLSFDVTEKTSGLKAN